MFKKSINSFKKKLYKPEELKNLLDRGNKYLINENIPKAIIYYEKLLLLDKNNTQAINNISYCYMLKDDYTNSKKYINRAIKTSPQNEFLYFNLGNLYKRFGKLNLALESYDKAIKIDSKNPNFQFNKSYVLLKKKLYKDAWNLYDNRIIAEYKNKKIFKIIKNNIYKKNQCPINQKIIIVPEQGIGDQILFSSMYKEFITLNPDCKIIIDKRLQNIFIRSFNFNNYIDELNFTKILYYFKKKYFFIYAGSLGKFFRNKISDFNGAPFLLSNSLKKKKFKDILLKYKKTKLIGISWHSGSKSMKRKSFNLNHFKKILNLKKFSFINLQYGNVSNEIKKFNDKNVNKIIDINNLNKYKDLDGLSSLISSLDLVITVENINVSFASSLGIKTWCLVYGDSEHFFYSKNYKKSCEWHNKLKIFYVKNSISETISKISYELEKKF